MSDQRPHNPIARALYVNAALLLAILALLLLRGQSAGSLPSLLPSAMAQAQGQASLAPGQGGVAVMPGQLATNTYGCYLLDPDAQTLCVYQFMPDLTLRLIAARNYKYDRQLKSFNTDPAPQGIKDLIDKAEHIGARTDVPPPDPGNK